MKHLTLSSVCETRSDPLTACTNTLFPSGRIAFLFSLRDLSVTIVQSERCERFMSVCQENRAAEQQQVSLTLSLWFLSGILRPILFQFLFSETSFPFPRFSVSLCFLIQWKPTPVCQPQVQPLHECHTDKRVDIHFNAYSFTQLFSFIPKLGSWFDLWQLIKCVSQLILLLIPLAVSHGYRLRFNASFSQQETHN